MGPASSPRGDRDNAPWQRMNVSVGDESSTLSSSRAWRLTLHSYCVCIFTTILCDLCRYFSEKLSEANLSSRLGIDMQIDELTRVLWLSGTLFFIVGGYWLLRVSAAMSSNNSNDYLIITIPVA
jgi:hypothetical protein